MVILWLAAVIFVVFSVSMFRGKASFFGEPGSPEKEKYDRKKLSAASGSLCLCIAAACAVIAYFDSNEITVGVIVLLCAVILLFAAGVEKFCKK